MPDLKLLSVVYLPHAICMEITDTVGVYKTLWQHREGRLMSAQMKPS